MANWFERLDGSIHERVDEIVQYLKEHGAGDVEDIVKQAVADELKGDSIVAILRDIVHSEITKFIAGAAAVTPAAAPVVTTPVVTPVDPTPVVSSSPPFNVTIDPTPAVSSSPFNVTPPSSVSTS